MKKNGFVSTTLIYTFFILFLSLMLILLNTYSRTSFLLGEYKDNIKNNFADSSERDIDVYIKVWNENTLEYETKEEVPDGISFQSEYSYCKNGGTINFLEGYLVVEAKEKDACYAYFKE